LCCGAARFLSNESFRADKKSEVVSAWMHGPFQTRKGRRKGACGMVSVHLRSREPPGERGCGCLSSKIIRLTDAGPYHRRLEGPEVVRAGAVLANSSFTVCCRSAMVLFISLSYATISFSRSSPYIQPCLVFVADPSVVLHLSMLPLRVGRRPLCLQRGGTLKILLQSRRSRSTRPSAAIERSTLP